MIYLRSVLNIIAGVHHLKDWCNHRHNHKTAKWEVASIGVLQLKCELNIVASKQ